MTRRNLLALTPVVPLALQAAPPVRLGIDLFSLRTQNWNAFQYLDYCAAQKAKVVHFSEVRFLGTLEKGNLQAIRRRATELGIGVEIGMKSIDPDSKMFDAKAGTAQEQLIRMIEAAGTVGSPIVRAVLGSMDDRRPGPIEKHIESTIKVLRGVRTRVMDGNLKIAIENHAGDMQARELKNLVEGAGRDFVGVCLDSGNPLWALEDPHLTLETLHPYVLTSHVRDSAVWDVPPGAAVSWVRMGEGNVDIAGYVRKYAELCPGRAISMETIVTGPRVFPYRQAGFWDAYRNTPAWEFARFEAIAALGKVRPKEINPRSAELERQDLEASLAFTKPLLGL